MHTTLLKPLIYVCAHAYTLGFRTLVLKTNSVIKFKLLIKFHTKFGDVQQYYNNQETLHFKSK